MSYGPLRLNSMERAKLCDVADNYAEQMRLSVNAGANRAEKAQAVTEAFVNAVEDILNENYEYCTENAAQFKTPE